MYDDEKTCELCSRPIASFRPDDVRCWRCRDQYGPGTEEHEDDA